MSKTERTKVVLQINGTITLAEFIEQLKQLDPDVLIGEDDNDYHPLTMLLRKNRISIRFQPQDEIDHMTMEWEDYKKKYGIEYD